jgi:uncharacterized protein YjbI with pentapeptide repeats
VRTPSPPQQTNFAAKAKDLQALRDAVGEAATVSGPLWISYLFVFFYLAIAAGGVTHRDLFFENPVKLPFLNVDLPLIGFFILGPLLFLIVHAYTVLHFTLLAGKVGDFRGELQEQIGYDEIQEGLSRQLPSNIFVQFLAGPADIRTGALGFMLRLIAWISLILGPIALLVFFQLQFLPYHHEVISWWQRFAVVLDLILLWVLWPLIARGTTAGVTWRDFRRFKVASLFTLTLLPVWLVFAVAIFPGEKLHEVVPFVVTEWTPHKLLVAGNVDLIGQRRRSLWSNTLVVPQLDLRDQLKFNNEVNIAGRSVTVSLRGRSLEGAILLGANLPKADFTGARHYGAMLDGADLREARFECAPTGSNTEGRDIQCADLQRASLRDVQLQGAKLDHAQLQGASFLGAKLQGASLVHAKLQGATLDLAQLQGADLGGAQLQGASLRGAALQGASLNVTQLQGASLPGAELMGAWLIGAKLQGTVLKRAQLQGTRLEGAELQSASLEGAFVWRTDLQHVKAEDTYVHDVTTTPKYEGLNCFNRDPCDWSAKAFAELKRLIKANVPAGDQRNAALGRVKRLDPERPEPQPGTWTKFELLPLPLSKYNEGLIIYLVQLGCDRAQSPYILFGLLKQIRLRFGSNTPEAKNLAVRLFTEDCFGPPGRSKQVKSLLYVESLHVESLRSLPPPPPVPGQ